MNTYITDTMSEHTALNERERGEVKNADKFKRIGTVYSPCGQRKRSINKDVNRMLMAANCMMKGPQLSMEEAHIHIRERGM